MKKYRVELTDEERDALQKFIRRGRRGKTSARKRTRARTLLMAGAGASDAEISAALGVGPVTVGYTRRRFVGAGLDALDDRPRPARPDS
jgi:transposase